MNNADHPAAEFCEGLTIGGFSDWYMPALNELEVCYYNLKPTTQSNYTSSGANVNSVPVRGNYTSGNPAQTASSDFKSTGTEDFDVVGYWCSTTYSDTSGWKQFFDNGMQDTSGKTNTGYVRAIRRVAI
jgi:hypothetical protein